jgi:hypothetical protein
MMRWLRWPPGIFILALFLGGCEYIPGGDLIKTALQVRGAKIADEVLEDARWVTCNAASVGSIKREYGRTVEDAQIYIAYCNIQDDPEANPIAPVPE